MSRFDTVVIKDPVTSVIEVITQGPQGVPGSIGDLTITKTAGETLSGHRIVVQSFADGKLYYADNTNLDHVHSVLGITTGAANAGADCQVRTYGSITEPTWSWTDNRPVFLSANGHLTQSKPTTGFLLRIGFPRSATTLFVDIEEPVKLI